MSGNGGCKGCYIEAATGSAVFLYLIGHFYQEKVGNFENWCVWKPSLLSLPDWQIKEFLYVAYLDLPIKCQIKWLWKFIWSLTSKTTDFNFNKYYLLPLFRYLSLLEQQK